MKPATASGMLAPADGTFASARKLPPPPVSTPPTGMGILPVSRASEVHVGVGAGGVVGVGVVILGVGVGVPVEVGVPLTGLGDGDGE